MLRWIGRTHLEEGHPERRLQPSGALESAEASRLGADEAHALNWLAIASRARATWITRKSCMRAHARARRARHDDHLIAMIDQNLGTIANIRGKLDLALRSYESSLTRYRALHLTAYEAHVLNNMGMLYTDLGDWDNAERAYEQARDACESDRRSRPPARASR